MSFVKTPAELAEIQRMLAEGKCTSEGISVEFETTPEFLRSVLPPCFDMPEKPTAFANISRWQSALCGEYDCGIIFLNCRYKGVEGTTILWIVVTGDMPVTIGREMWGEPKKTGIANVYVDGHEFYGYAERNGQRLIEISADLGPDKGPFKNKGFDFELKATPHVTGIGLQDEVIMTCLEYTEDFRVRRDAKATLKFSGSELDPLHTIPVVQVISAAYSQGESSWTVPWFEKLSDSDAYLPFIYGQKFDDFRLFHRAKRFV